MSIADAGAPQASGQEQSISFSRILLIGFLACLMFSRTPIIDIWQAGAFGDTDDAMRMVQVRDWMAGQAWYDLRAMRLDPPAGTLMHWSRVVDVPVAGLIRFFGLFADQETAERLARIVFPLSIQGLLLVAIGLSGRLLAGHLGGMLAILLVVCSGMSLGQFIPGRIDHHAPQIVLLSFMTWACLCGLDPQRPRMAGLAGLFAAMSLAIAIENLPFIIVLMAIYPLAWAALGAPMRAALIWIGVGFATSLILLYGLFQSPTLWGAGFCDALSAVHIRAAVAGGVAMVLLGAFDRWRKPGLLERMLATGLAGLLAAAPLVLDRQCYLDPFVGLDPLVRELWLSNVQEAVSLPKRWVEHPEDFLSLVMPWVVGTAAIAVAAVTERGLARTRYMALLALTLVGCATAWYMVRSASSVSPLALLGCIWAVTRVRAWHGKDDVRAAILVLLTIAPFTVVAWVMVSPGKEKTEETTPAKPLGDCLAEASLGPLRTLPKGIVLALPDLGPFILVFTNHSVMAGPYHRNNRGNRLMFDVFMASPDKARDMMRAAGVRYVAVCDAKKKGGLLKERAPEGFSAAIANEAPMDWLRPIPLDTPLSVFEVSPGP